MDDQLKHYIKEHGCMTYCGSNSPAVLSGNSTIYFIEKGFVDVFVTDLEKGQPFGKRRHVTRQYQNGLLFSSNKAIQSGLSLIAVGTAETIVKSIELTALVKFLSNDITPLIVPFNNWLESLFKVFQKKTEGTALQTKMLTDHIEGKAGTFTFIGTCKWLKLNDGNLKYLNTVEIEKNELIPIGMDVAINAANEFNAAITNSADIISTDNLSPLIIKVNSLFLKCFQEKIKSEEVYNINFINERDKKNKSRINYALQNILSVLNPKDKSAAVFDESNSELITAFQIVTKELSINFKANPKKNYTLNQLSQDSGCQIRSVHLIDRWWLNDSGPLLVKYREQKLTCAAIFNNNCYRLYHPQHKEWIVIDDKVVNELEPDGFCTYRPLPDSKINSKTLFKFASFKLMPDIISMILAGAVIGLLGIVTPVMTGVLFSTILPNAAVDQLHQVILGLIAAALGVAGFSLVKTFALLRITAKSAISLESAMFDRLIRLPIGFFKRFTTGDLSSRFMAINTVHHTLLTVTISAVLSLIFSLFNLALMFYYSAQAALLICGLVLIVAIVTLFISIKQSRYTAELEKINGKVSGIVLEILKGITKIQAACAEIKVFSLWSKYFVKQKQAFYKAHLYAGAQAAFDALVSPLTLITLFMIASFILPNMPIGMFIAFNAAMGQFFASMLGLTHSLSQTIDVIPKYKRAKPILETTPDVSLAKDDPPALSGKVGFNCVDFQYHKDGPMILKNVSFEIEPGQFVAFVGGSGAGKSTIARLLLGLETPTNGAIYFDDQDLSKLNTQKVRQQIGVVLQNSSLMADTIFQNIIGSFPLTIDDAWLAAEQAGMAGEIKDMPMGMHTILSEGGGTLSGGQRQRLMIARALVRQPNLLIFDEATSALDNHTQKIVQQSVDNLSISKVVIAHRLSTIINADKIIMLDKGRIIEQGSYQELMDLHGEFYQFASRQLA